MGTGVVGQKISSCTEENSLKEDTMYFNMCYFTPPNSSALLWFVYVSVCMCFCLFFCLYVPLIATIALQAMAKQVATNRVCRVATEWPSAHWDSVQRGRRLLGQGCHSHGKVMEFLGFWKFLEFLEKSWNLDYYWPRSWKSHGILK